MNVYIFKAANCLVALKMYTFTFKVPKDIG